MAFYILVFIVSLWNLVCVLCSQHVSVGTSHIPSINSCMWQVAAMLDTPAPHRAVTFTDSDPERHAFPWGPRRLMSLCPVTSFLSVEHKCWELFFALKRGSVPLVNWFTTTELPWAWRVWGLAKARGGVCPGSSGVAWKGEIQQQSERRWVATLPQTLPGAGVVMKVRTGALIPTPPGSSPVTYRTSVCPSVEWGWQLHPPHWVTARSHWHNWFKCNAHRFWAQRGSSSRWQFCRGLCPCGTDWPPFLLSFQHGHLSLPTLNPLSAEVS